jgi:phage terminase Nu1 subunit (DNA packaging protein)
MPAVSVKELARVFEESEASIHLLVQQGMPRISRGKYELGNCLLWYVRFLRAKLKSRAKFQGDPQAAREREERLLLLCAQRQLAQVEAARACGEFAAIADFERALTAMVVTTKARLLTLPSRLATQLVGQDRFEIESRLDKEIKSALTTLSKNGDRDSGAKPEK